MDIKKVSSRMRADWDRRIEHDHRFWMSDGYDSDDAMWRTGERDFEIIARDIPAPHEKTILEIGCGVGRLLRAALSKYLEVIGIDVSEVALKKAGEFLKGTHGLRLIPGNGLDLSEVVDSSVDVVFSFAALCSIPTPIIARYLLESNRVLRDGGLLRLQFYFGE
ncbi:MAG: class I SAM-dependent methyltransferase, partial [Bdellovibrionales bacterium]|nr:class I SAM-dependent methyltransferase [Bdellovibrionales bacterium]